MDQRRLNYTSAEECGCLVLWYSKESLCDSFNTFQKQDYFILSSQTAGRMKDLSIIFYLLPAFNSPHSFSRPSFVQSLSPQRLLFLSSLTFKGSPPFYVMRVVSNQSLWDERHPHSPIQFKTKRKINIFIFKWVSCFHNSFSNCCNCNKFCCSSKT